MVKLGPLMRGRVFSTVRLLSQRRLLLRPRAAPMVNSDDMDQHITTDPEGTEVDNFWPASEALGMPAASGLGWAREFGETIGENERYTIKRKLGWGMHSSTWLARDKHLKKYVAIKALTGHMTKMYERAVIWEADALRLLSYHPQSEHCVQSLDDFTTPGRGSAGEHLCLVMPLYGGDVKALARSQARRGSPFPLPLAKRIILHLLRGIAYAHGRGVVHTDLKQDNIFFDTHASDADIERWMEEDPPRRHLPEMSYDGIVQAAVSQPMKLPSEEEALCATYLLADFGCAQPSNLHDDRTITTILFRPPEVILGGKWDKPADIWSFGCLTYELITHRHLFHYEVNKKFGLSEIANILYQMMLYTGEIFLPPLLNVCPLASEYFYGECQLKKDPKILEWPLEHLVGMYKVVPEEDLPAIANFIRRCLRLDPNDRATAQELLSDPWLNTETE